MKLLPEDHEFIELIQEEISEACAIPLEIPPHRIARKIEKAAKWFYQWHPYAIQESKYIIKCEDLQRDNSTGSRDPFTTKHLLPEAIKYVFRVKRATGNRSLAEAAYLRSPLLSLARFRGGNGNSLSPHYYQNSSNSLDFMSTTLALYEYSAYEQFSERNRGIKHDWNEYTHEISFLTDINEDIVLEVGQRVPITALYAEDLFENYVTATCLQSLSAILGTYNYQLIGNVSINFGDIKERGDSLLEKVESTVRGFNSNSFIYSR